MNVRGGNDTAAAAPRDDDLVARVLAGDRECYSDLVRRYQDELYRYACGMGVEHDAALDLVQDAFLRAYVSLKRCRDRRRFRVWLFRILRNRCLDYFRSAERRGVPLDSAALRVDAEVDAFELSAALDRAFAALPPLLREAFLLYHRDGFAYDEISELAGVSVSAIKMRVHRAREALRDSLQAAEVTGV